MVSIVKVDQIQNSDGTVEYLNAGTIKNVNVEVGASLKMQTTAPGSPASGHLYYDSSNDRLKLYDGSNYILLTAEKVKKVFVFTGQDQTFTVPSNIRYLDVKLWGAGGGGERVAGPHTGGSGGYVSGTIDLEDSTFVSTYGNLKGTTLYVAVGRGGNQSEYYDNNTYINPYYGGGGKGRDNYNGAGSEVGDGGGLSGIFKVSPYNAPSTYVNEGGNFTANATLAQTLVISGGGGGAGDGKNGGAGGGNTGRPDESGDSLGGTQTQGYGSGNAEGRFLLGGSNVGSNASVRAGAGGGGLYGGEGATGDRQGGGGGSSYTNGLTSNIVNTQGSDIGTGTNTGGGNLPPNLSDEDMQFGVGVGGSCGDDRNFSLYGDNSGGHTGAGGHGLVVISYVKKV